MEKNVIIKQLDMLIVQNSPEELKNQDFSGKSIIEDLEFDSVSLMQLVAGIEDVFGVNLDTSDSMLELLDDYDELLGFM